ncbi:MAG: trypsin-like peptidase domain-containing protein [Candidatus Pacebacteria bacterium]|nr:trypsin-like peptidase domain-containing protein [Candidatus Paceibacterota bacterium]MBP9851484.1 trypsin-like peptidase domain-containing protein [Candidatus Paceibacterota bacterium]
MSTRYLMVGITSSLVTVFLVGVGVWNFRAQIFGYFATEYLKSTSIVASKLPADVKIPEEVTTDLIAEIVDTKPENLDQKKENTVIDTVKQTNPAVVSIIITKEVPKYEVYNDPSQKQNPFGDLLPGFNINIPQYRQNGTEKKEVGGGSGFFVSSDGLIVTNRHVVSADNVEYAVYTNSGKKYDAKVVARDQVLDIALIKVTGSGFPYLKLGDSDGLEVGQTVIAIGNALAEFKNSVSVGVISGLSRSITAGDGAGATELLDKVIQTDAAINPGNSGGPLLNLAGEVVGVNVAVAQGSENIGFALPINSVKSAIDSVKATGKIVRPYLGIRYIAINPEMKAKNNLTVDYGVLVKSGNNANELAVVPGSPADKAGIVENDIILEVDGQKLGENTSLASAIRGKKVGNVVPLRVLHKGVEKTVYVTLEAAKDN